MMGPYKAPKFDEEIIGYELYYPRVCTERTALTAVSSNLLI
jgi:hypothetical protein